MKERDPVSGSLLVIIPFPVKAKGYFRSIIVSLLSKLTLLSPHPFPLPRGERVRVRGNNRNIGYAIINKGTILITTIIILAFLSILAMSLAAFIFSRHIIEIAQLDRLQALYLAEAGIAKSIYELKHDTDLDRNGVGNIAKTPLGRGSFQAEHDFQTSSIKAKGTVGGITRTIQIKYRAL